MLRVPPLTLDGGRSRQKRGSSDRETPFPEHGGRWRSRKWAVRVGRVSPAVSKSHAVSMVTASALLPTSLGPQAPGCSPHTSHQGKLQPQPDGVTRGQVRLHSSAPHGRVGPGGLEGTSPGTEASVLALVGMRGRGQGSTCHLVPRSMRATRGTARVESASSEGSTSPRRGFGRKLCPPRSGLAGAAG